MEQERFNNFEDWINKEMQDDEFRDEYECLGPGFKVFQFRMAHGMTQAELAQLVGTHQPNNSRLENGEKEPSLSFLGHVVEALDGQVVVQISASSISKICTNEKVTNNRSRCR